MGPRQLIADQLLAKADVFERCTKRVQLCQDPQTEFALPRESLGSGRINRTHTLLQGRLAPSDEDSRLVPHARGSNTWMHTWEVFSRPTILSPTSRNGLATERGQALVSADSVDPSWDHNLNTEKPAAPPKLKVDIVLAFMQF